MKPEVKLWIPPKGAEFMAVPEEMEAPRNHIIHLCAHLMKLYGIKVLDCNPSMLGPCGVTTPYIEVMPAYQSIRPLALEVTEVTAMRGIIPLMMAFGILKITLELDEKDKEDMLKLWANMTPVKETPPTRPKVITDDIT